MQIAPCAYQFRLDHARLRVVFVPLLLELGFHLLLLKFVRNQVDIEDSQRRLSGTVSQRDRSSVFFFWGHA